MPYYVGDVPHVEIEQSTAAQQEKNNFINEPYITGGNPISSSKDGVMFNDMLGSTLNIGGKPVKMTAFGESADAQAMYTGKPFIGELGYAFLFRNYRPDKGKWLTADPLGYPDGWNQLAYCGNKCTNSIDFCGKWTIQIGISLTGGGSVGATVGWGFAISYDAEGGFRSGFYGVGGGGAYVGAGGSLTLDVTISGNQTIEALRGTTMTVGTSLGAGIGVGAEINIPADFPGNASESLTFSVGVSGGPLPFEQHTFVTQTFIPNLIQAGGRINNVVTE